MQALQGVVIGYVKPQLLQPLHTSMNIIKTRLPVANWRTIDNLRV